MGIWPPAGRTFAFEGGCLTQGFLTSQSGDTLTVRVVVPGMPRLPSTPPLDSDDDDRPGADSDPEPDQDGDSSDRGHVSSSSSRSSPRRPRSRSPRRYGAAGCCLSKEPIVDKLMCHTIAQVDMCTCWNSNDDVQTWDSHRCTPVEACDVKCGNRKQTQAGHVFLLGVCWAYWWALLCLECTVKAIGCKGVDAPGLASYEQELHTTPPTEPPPPYQRAPPDLAVEQPEVAPQPQPPTQMQWCFVLLTARVCKEFVNVVLPVPSTVGRALRTVGNARDHGRERLYQQLAPAAPQPAHDFLHSSSCAEESEGCLHRLLRSSTHRWQALLRTHP